LKAHYNHRKMKRVSSLRNKQRVFSKKTNWFLAKDKQINAHIYNPLPVVLSRGKGVELWDVDGKRYLDCIAGFGTMNHGHLHPKVYSAVLEQFGKLTMVGRCVLNDQMPQLQLFLKELFGFDKSLLMNSGAEAGESAVKMAKKWGCLVKGIPMNEARVVFPKKNFWGRTITAAASTDDPIRSEGFGPYGVGLDLVDFNNLEALEDYFKTNPNCAGYMFEPVQGEAGVVIPDDGYYKGVRELCTKYNVLMMSDEVQCGLGRTGYLKALDCEDVRPDVLIIAKALSAGFYPVSAVLADSHIMDVWHPGCHGSTFSGNPVASVASKAALEALVEENMVENAYEKGAWLLNEMQRMKPHWCQEIRGKGMWFAIAPKPESGIKAEDFMLKAMDEGMLCYKAGGNTVRMSPPLIFTQENCEEMMEKLTSVMQKV